MEEFRSNSRGSAGECSELSVLGSSGLAGHVATAHVLFKKGKRYAAQYLYDECLRNLVPSQDISPVQMQVLPELLDLLLNPESPIKSWETIDWLKWLMASGRTPDEFFTTVRRYDNATTCGLVWTANFVAYRCRTCGISPCMSLCAQCFQEGNHEGHDFNMFRSQAGGACDCGNAAVMKESGFCQRHGAQAQLNKPEVPPDLLAIADAMMPRIILRFIQHCREHSGASLDQLLEALEDASQFLDMLQDLSRLGAAMRRSMTRTLCNPNVYSDLTCPSPNNKYNDYLVQSKKLYDEALRSIPFSEAPPGYDDIAILHGPLVHQTFLDEIVFWTVKFEFPQKLVCFLLNMLPDSLYEHAFARTFVEHYSRISVMLVRSIDSDSLSNRVVHVSVQLFSDQDLAYRMTDSYHLLHVMVVSLKTMMKSICVASTLGDKDHNQHRVVNCGENVMKNHCYWPLVSDLNNVLSHRQIAVKFMSDPRLIREWFSFLSLFQAMNVNTREMSQHIEFEPQTYYAAFSAELEASASPMWALVSHLRDADGKHYSFAVLKECLKALSDWFTSIGFVNLDWNDEFQVSFHLPLHRYYSVFMCQAIKAQGATLQDVLPNLELLHLIMYHPLAIQVSFYEILCGVWVRNGLQIKGQAMTYIQCHFCNSMVDADLYLLQICAGELPANNFLMTILDRFHILDSLSLAPGASNGFLDAEHETALLESCLTFLATVAAVRTNIGLSELELTQLEMVTLLCMSDKTHSQLIEYMPEKCGTSTQGRDFETVLNKISSYKAPNFEASGTMQQGMYVPKDEVWEHLYDPIYVLLRAVQRREFQGSLDRFKQHCKQSGRNTSSGNLWPPFRIPSPVCRPYTDPQRLLACRTTHAVLLVFLYNALNDVSSSDHLLALAIHLLELIVEFEGQKCDNENAKREIMKSRGSSSLPISEDETDRPDGQFTKWFSSDSIFTNASVVVQSIRLGATPSVSSCSDGEMDTADFELEELERFSTRLALPGGPSHYSPQVSPPRTFSPRPLMTGSELVLYDSFNSAVVATDSPTTPDSPFPLALTSPTNLSASSPVASGANMLVSITQQRANYIAGSLSGSILPPHHFPSLLSGTEVVRQGERRTERAGAPRRRTRSLADWTASFHGRTRRPAGGNSAASWAPSFSPRQSQKERSEDSVLIGESLITLLLKLHSKLSGQINSYAPNFEAQIDSRIGDGPFFIGKVLDKLGRYDVCTRRSILETLGRLNIRREEGPTSEEELKATEVRRHKARERKQRVMAEFAMRQRQFMEQNREEVSRAEEEGGGEAMEGIEEEEEGSSGRGRRNPLDRISKEYDCVICSQSIPSTSERPVGLVVLVQASSVLGHKTTSREPYQIPTTDAEKLQLRQSRYTLGQHMEERAELLSSNFDVNSWLVSMNIGWCGGVHVQTCGHHLHLDCHQAYLLALKSQPRQNATLNVDKGEYWCPLCRQLGNAVVPISPKIGDLSYVVKHPSSRKSDLVEEIDQLLADLTVPAFSASLTEAMAKAMEDMTVATYPKYRNVSAVPSTPSLFMFVTSILRTNLEMELVQRGGGLVNQIGETKMDVKRSCLMPLIHVLGFHAKILTGGGSGDSGGCNWIRSTWNSICQRPLRAELEGVVKQKEKQVPLLLCDPVTLLLQMVVLLPERTDREYYHCLVLHIYRVCVLNASVSALCPLSEAQRELAATNGPLAPLLALALRGNSLFSITSLVTLRSEFDPSTWSVNDVTCEVRKSCLQFLRIAAMLKCHLLEDRIPMISDPVAECGALEQMLNVWESCSVVNSAVMGNMCGRFTCGMVDLTSPVVETRLGDLASSAAVWCFELSAFANVAQVASQKCLAPHRFFRPRLMTLPRSYDAIFQYYHRRPCLQCNHIPKDPSVCLLCGTVVCLREMCCKRQDVCECVQHAIDCGAGTAVFLVVNSSTVIVIRGPRACLWGCVHLDSFGEEDRDLKRGKPLYLSEDRYSLLEQQWLMHLFDHTNKRWIWHRDIL